MIIIASTYIHNYNIRFQEIGYSKIHENSET